MADLPTGAEFGMAVHAVLERVDPQAADLAAELRRAGAGRAGTGCRPASFTADQLAEGLLPAFAHVARTAGREPTLADIPRPTGWPS